MSDLAAVVASTTGKIEIESFGEVREEKIVDKIVQGAIVRVFGQHFREGDLADIVEQFDSGIVVEAGSDVPSTEYSRAAERMPGLARAVSSLDATGNPATVASAVEFVLEGLHLTRKLNKDRASGRARYRK
jgi:magnesium chelatase subunit I